MAESLKPAAPLPSKPALIHNPRSHRNRGRDVDLPAGLLVAEPATPEELDATIADFAQRKVDLIIVSGGDGTLRDILGLLPKYYGEHWPAFALIRAGNSNSIAIDVGSIRPGRSAIRRILDCTAQQRWSRETARAPMMVSWPDGGRAPVFGFFMGAAALTRATQFAQTKVAAGGRLSVVLTLMVTLWQCVSGDSEWLAGDRMSLCVDAAAAQTRNRFLFIATSLHKIMLRIWPFWDYGDRPIHYVDIDAHPQAFGRSLLPLLFGRPTTFMRRNGYHSGGAERMSLQMDSSLIIDGEAFEPDAQGRFEITTGPQIRFLSP